MRAKLRTDDFIERAMHTWGNAVYRLALNQTRSSHDADDICQEVFLRLLNDATVFKDDEHLKAWLLCVTINCSRDLHRSAWRRRAELADALEEERFGQGSSEDESARAWCESDLGCALRKLPDKTRLIVHLFYYEGYSTEEIAQLAHCLPATVRTRLRRARIQLKGLLEKEASYEANE